MVNVRCSETFAIATIWFPVSGVRVSGMSVHRRRNCKREGQAVEAAEKQRVHESIMKGFDDIKSGFGRPVDVAFADVRKRLEEHIGAKP